MCMLTWRVFAETVTNINVILHTVYVYSNTASHDISIMTVFQETIMHTQFSNMYIFDLFMYYNLRYTQNPVEQTVSI